MSFHSRLLPCIATPCLLLVSFSLVIGCGSGSTSPTVTGTPATIPPSITTQPASLTVPIGLEGIFRVGVTGDGTLTEQWFRNGVAISSTDAVSYTTPTVAATDTGSIFTVTISNSLGSVSSQPASLTAGARAPEDGDLRFQQVDSLNTINGYTGAGGIGDQINDLGGSVFTNAFGTLDLNYEECSPVPVAVYDCLYILTPFAQPTGAVPLTAGFFGDLYDNFETDLSDGFFPSSTSGGGSLLDPNTVVTSMAIAAADDRFAMSYLQTSQTGGFDLAQHTIDPSQIQAAATQEGQSSRVITALAFASGQLVYFSYGWTGDTNTVYETQAATATFDNVGAVASSLAAQGYIITAIGGDAIDGIVLIGTRVQGDTLPRQILVIPYGPDLYQLPAGGYAIVGSVNDLLNNPATGFTIGER